MEVTVKFELLDGDITNSVNAFPQIKKMRFFGMVALGLAAMTLLAGAVNGELASGLATVVTMTVFGGVFFTIPYFSARSALQNFTAEERRLTMRLEEGGIHVTSGKGESSSPWDAVHRVVESQDVFLIYTTEQCAHFLPKRLLSPENTETIRNLVASKVEPRKAPSKMKYVIIVWLALVMMFALISALTAQNGG